MWEGRAPAFAMGLWRGKPARPKWIEIHPVFSEMGEMDFYRYVGQLLIVTWEGRAPAFAMGLW